MSLLIFFSVILRNDNDKCSLKDGSYILNIKFHIDELTYKKINVNDETTDLFEMNMGSHELLLIALIVY